MTTRLPNQTILRLAAEAGRDPKTVIRMLNGTASTNSREAITAAARRLGVTLPADVTLDDSPNISPVRAS